MKWSLFHPNVFGLYRGKEHCILSQKSSKNIWSSLKQKLKLQSLWTVRCKWMLLTSFRFDWKWSESPSFRRQPLFYRPIHILSSMSTMSEWKVLFGEQFSVTDRPEPNQRRKSIQCEFFRQAQRKIQKSEILTNK